MVAEKIIFPPRFDSDVPKAGFSVFDLNIALWLKHPSQWLNGAQVAWGNYQLSRKYQQESKTGEPAIWDYTRKRMADSRAYSEALAEYWPGIMHPARGSITIAATPKETEGQKADSKLFAKEGLEFSEVPNTFGFQGADSLWIDHHNRIACDDFPQSIQEGIKEHNGKVVIGEAVAAYDDTRNQSGGVLVYKDAKTQQEHYRTYSKLTLALGNTAYAGVNNQPMIVVSGMSADLLITGLFTVPLVMGPNHLVPMGSKMVTLPGKTQPQLVTWCRYTTGGDVEPVVRNDGTVNTRHVAHAFNRLDALLPPEVEIFPVRVEKCQRILSAEGQPNERQALVKVDDQVVKSDNILIVGPQGGGGLTGMAIGKTAEDVAALKQKTEERSKLPTVRNHGAFAVKSNLPHTEKQELPQEGLRKTN